MLVLHPIYGNTAIMSVLYDESKVYMLDPYLTADELAEKLCSCPDEERIMLLGYGTKNGLLAHEDGFSFMMHRLIIGPVQAELLRAHGKELIGLWNNSATFARKENLEGLFCEGLITNLREAESRGIITLQMHIDESLETMFTELSNLLSIDCPLKDIPNRMKKLSYQQNGIGSFNYSRFKYVQPKSRFTP